MSERSRGALGGLLFAALMVVALATLPPPPDANASATTVRHYFSNHSGAIRTASAVSALAALAFVVLTAALRRRLDGSAAADVIFGGGVVVAAVSVAGSVLQAGLANAQPRLPDAGLLSSFATERMVFYVGPPLGMVLVALAAAIAFRGVLPSWLAGGSALLGVVALVGGVATTVSDSNGVGAIALVGLVLTILWSAATGIVLLRERPAAA